MDKKEDTGRPVLLHVEPVLAVKDVSESVEYWHNVLGFPDKWLWGDPPDHGGVSWSGTQVQFSQNPELAAVSEGHSLWVRVQQLERLYSLHQEKNARIVAPLENKPWGMAEYVVREINGYFVRFAAPALEKKEKSEQLPAAVRIISRVPTPSEYRRLISAVNWSNFVNDTMVETALTTVLHAVVAENAETGEVVGCALLLGDNASFLYVKDVMVHPDWQCKHVGAALMKELMQWVESNAPDKVFVGLFTGENLSPFYKQFGFSEIHGMHRRINKSSI